MVFRASATLNYRARFAEILCKSNPYKILQCFVQFRYGYKVSGYYSIIKTFLLSHYFRLTVTEKADIMKEHRTGKPFQNRPKSESLSVFTRLFVDGDSMVTCNPAFFKQDFCFFQAFLQLFLQLNQQIVPILWYLPQNYYFL